MPKIIITGGPGSGKSTLLEALGKIGFACVPEASRQLIQQQVALGTDCLPWKDLAGFARLSLDKMTSDYVVDNHQDTFFDRGIPDIIAYLQAGGLGVPPFYYETAKRFSYAATVFIAPPWKHIYINDAERWQTFEEACILYEAIKNVYKELGYNLIEIPCVPVEKRVRFLLGKLNENNLKRFRDEHILPETLPSVKS